MIPSPTPWPPPHPTVHSKLNIEYWILIIHTSVCGWVCITVCAFMQSTWFFSFSFGELETLKITSDKLTQLPQGIYSYADDAAILLCIHWNPTIVCSVLTLKVSFVSSICRLLKRPTLNISWSANRKSPVSHEGSAQCTRLPHRTQVCKMQRCKDASVKCNCSCLCVNTVRCYGHVASGSAKIFDWRCHTTFVPH